MSFLWYFNEKRNSLQSLSSVFQGLFSVKNHEAVPGSNNVFTFPDPLGAVLVFLHYDSPL